MTNVEFVVSDLMKDSLPTADIVLANLTVDKDGAIKIPRDALDNRQHIQIVAVDPEQTLVRWISLPEQKIEIIDLRLAKGLDPNAHVIQQKQVSLVPADKQLVLPDMSGWDVIRKFRLNGPNKNTIVLMATVVADRSAGLAVPIYD